MADLGEVVGGGEVAWSGMSGEGEAREEGAAEGLVEWHCLSVLWEEFGLEVVILNCTSRLNIFDAKNRPFRDLPPLASLETTSTARIHEIEALSTKELLEV